VRARPHGPAGPPRRPLRPRPCPPLNRPPAGHHGFVTRRYRIACAPVPAPPPSPPDRSEASTRQKLQAPAAAVALPPRGGQHDEPRRGRLLAMSGGSLASGLAGFRARYVPGVVTRPFTSERAAASP